MKAILIVASLVLASGGAAAQTDWAEARSRLQHAAGTLPSQSTMVVAEGTAKRWGTDAPYRLSFDGNGRFARWIGGHREWTLAYDGTEVWESDGSAGPVVVAGVDWELPLLITWIQTGYWLDPDAPLDRTVEDADGLAIAVKLNAGRMIARVAIDGDTLRPSSVTLEDIGLRVTFEDWREAGGLWLPGNVSTEPAYFGHFAIDTMGTQPLATDTFTQPERSAPGTRFTDDDDTVPIKRMPSGHLMIHPTLDGQDVGWFILDTGAGMATLSPEVADQLELESFGAEAIMGMGGVGETAALRTGATLTLGPLQIDDVIWNQAAGHLARMDGMVEEHIVGALGWDLLARAAVRFNPDASTLQLRPPGGFELPADQTQKLFIEWRVPNVEVRYEGDRTGILMVDTGAGSFGAFFTSAWVERLDLLDGRQTEDAEGHGIGGPIAIKIGTLDWIEVAGHRIENPRVGFSVGEDHEDDPYYQGVLGNPVLGQFRMVLDYRKGLISLQPLGADR